MKKLNYRQVRDNINNHVRLNNISERLFDDDSTLFNCIVFGIVDSINENIEDDFSDATEKETGRKFDSIHKPTTDYLESKQ